MHLEILWENIPLDLQTNFLKLENINTFGSSYDFESVMHFSKDHLNYAVLNTKMGNRRNRTPKNWARSLTGEIPELWQQEQIFDGLSMWDAWEINMAYNLEHHCEQQGGLWKFWDRKNQMVKLNHTFDGENTCDTNFPGNGFVRLVGDSGFSGRVEVFKNQYWGSVCDSENKFDNTAATVICQDLGFVYGAVMEQSEVLSKHKMFKDGKIWMDGVVCDGTEKSFNECKYVELVKQSICDHTQDVGVTCSNDIVRLRTGLSGKQNEGIVEYYDYEEQSWGGICSRGFGEKDANVICKELNFDGGRAEI